MFKRLLVAALVGLLPQFAHADEPQQPLAGDIESARSLAMGGATRASGLANDTIYLNPAAISQIQRYTLSLQGEHDFNTQYDTFGASVLDSTTGPLAAGFGYNRVLIGPSATDGLPGDRRVGNLFTLAVAVPLSDAIVLGASGKFLHIAEFGDTHNVATPDVGVLIKAAPVNLGFVAYNLIDVHSRELPRQYGFGANVSLGTEFKLEGDLVLDTATNPTVSLAYRGGVEWEVLPVLALRGGYVEDRILGQRAISGGLGIYIPPGFGIDVAYKHELLGTRPERLFAISVNLAF
jgi:hypothetical protein